MKERFGPGKLHGFTLDEDEMNPLGSIIKQLRPARDSLFLPNRGINHTIESSQRLKRANHLFAL